MKKYTKQEWMKQQILEGMSLQDIANECGASRYTISKYFTKVINSLTIEEIIKLSLTQRDIKKLISPKTLKFKEISKKTNFLPVNSPLRQRLWHLQHHTISTPRCKMCSAPVNWNKDDQAYRTYCSLSCQGKDSTVKEKRKQSTLKSLGVEFPVQNKSVKEKYTKTMMKRHGKPFPNQTHIPDESLLILHNKEKLQRLYNKEKTTFRVAKILQVSQAEVSKWGAKTGILTNNRSGIEEEMFDFLINEFPSIKIDRNTRRIIPPQELDFFFPEYNIAIEINGVYWHSDLIGKDKHYHKEKTTQCRRKGIRLIQIYDTEWNTKQELIKSRLRVILRSNSLERVFARKCKVRIIKPKESNDFLTHHHIQSSRPALVHIGLFYQDQLVSCMTFTTPRFTKGHQYELLRFATIQNTVVVGGAGKMLSFFIKEFSPSSIISYSDLRWNTGNTYIKIGFIHLHTSSPNYWYFDSNLNLQSRVAFQKHKLKDKLDVFDPSLSEWENMKMNGYNRIWDCGNDVYVWTS